MAEPAGIDTSVPHSARIWNYWLGGTDNYPVDRAAGDAWAAVDPGIFDLARAIRAFLRRAVAGDSAVQVVGLMRSAEQKFLRLGVRDSLELRDDEQLLVKLSYRFEI